MGRIYHGGVKRDLIRRGEVTEEAPEYVDLGEIRSFYYGRCIRARFRKPQKIFSDMVR